MLPPPSAASRRRWFNRCCLPHPPPAIEQHISRLLRTPRITLNESGAAPRRSSPPRARTCVVLPARQASNSYCRASARWHGCGGDPGGGGLAGSRSGSNTCGACGGCGACWAARVPGQGPGARARPPVVAPRPARVRRGPRSAVCARALLREREASLRAARARAHLHGAAVVHARHGHIAEALVRQHRPHAHDHLGVWARFVRAPVSRRPGGQSHCTHSPCSYRTHTPASHAHPPSPPNAHARNSFLCLPGCGWAPPPGHPPFRSSARPPSAARRPRARGRCSSGATRRTTRSGPLAASAALSSAHSVSLTKSVLALNLLLGKQLRDAAECVPRLSLTTPDEVHVETHIDYQLKHEHSQHG